MAVKTVTLERYHLYGTADYALQLTYGGRILHHHEKGIAFYQTALDAGQDVIDNFLAVAKKRGFTHIKYTGNWERRTKPRGGKLK